MTEKKLFEKVTEQASTEGERQTIGRKKGLVYNNFGGRKVTTNTEKDDRAIYLAGLSGAPGKI